MVRTRAFVLAAVAGLALALAACGGGPTGPSDFNIDGTWSGFSAARGLEYSMSISQSGSTIAGTWNTAVGSGGQVTGSRSGANLTLTLNGGGNLCSLSLSTTISTSTSMSGTLAGINCVSNAGGPITLIKS
jgi:hypothetical protein